jgi:hypothetical protein
MLSHNIVQDGDSCQRGPKNKEEAVIPSSSQPALEFHPASIEISVTELYGI